MWRSLDFTRSCSFLSLLNSLRSLSSFDWMLDVRSLISELCFSFIWMKRSFA